jgi:large subunit ribosomal protein L20
MPRVKRGVQASARHKKVLKQAKGYRGARSRIFKTANQAVIKAGQYAYRDRRAAARENGMSYSRFINGLMRSEVEVDRKVLADIAVHDSKAFSALVEQAKAGLH